MKLNKHRCVTVLKRAYIQSIIVIYYVIMIKMKCLFTVPYFIKYISQKKCDLYPPCE